MLQNEYKKTPLKCYFYQLGNDSRWLWTWCTLKMHDWFWLFEEKGSVLNFRQGQGQGLWLDRETSTFWAAFQAGWTGRQSSLWNTNTTKTQSKKKKKLWMCSISIVFCFKIKAGLNLWQILQSFLFTACKLNLTFTFVWSYCQKLIQQKHKVCSFNSAKPYLTFFCRS